MYFLYFIIQKLLNKLILEIFLNLYLNASKTKYKRKVLTQTLELIKNFEIVTFLTYKLGAYDEFTDTFIFSKLIKVYRH